MNVRARAPLAKSNLGKCARAVHIPDSPASSCTQYRQGVSSAKIFKLGHERARTNKSSKIARASFTSLSHPVHRIIEKLLPSNLQAGVRGGALTKSNLQKMRALLAPLPLPVHNIGGKSPLQHPQAGVRGRARKIKSSKNARAARIHAPPCTIGGKSPLSHPQAGVRMRSRNQMLKNCARRSRPCLSLCTV